MAIAAIPTNFIAQQGNGQVSLTWNLIAGAVTYQIQRSTDGITYSNLAAPSVNKYLDTSVTIGTQYWYQVASVNGSGTSPYTSPLSVIPSPSGELSLMELRLRSQQKADRVNSQFVTTEEWNAFINLSALELYDLLIDTYEDYFVAPAITFVADGSTSLFNLPDGTASFTGPNGSPIVAAPFYKLFGVDLALNNAANAYVTVNKFNFIDRNRFVYPNSASTIYGVFNLQYRLVGSQIDFIPTPSGNQRIRIWYIPRMNQLLQENDITTIGYSGWLNYVICRAAKYALDKEESDTTNLGQELLFLKTRIEGAAMNRDAGRPDTISDTRQGNWADGWRGGSSGAIGGF